MVKLDDMEEVVGEATRTRLMRRLLGANVPAVLDVQSTVSHRKAGMKLQLAGACWRLPGGLALPRVPAIVFYLKCC